MRRPIPSAIPTVCLALALLAGCSDKKDDVGVDLVISTAPTSTPASPTTDDPVSVQFAIANTGANATGTVPWKAFFEDDEIASGTVGPLAGGAQAPVTFLIGSNVQAGTHTITVVADPDNTLAEDSNGNNSASLLLAVTAAPARLDLNFDPGALTVSPSPPTSTNGTISFGVRNSVVGLGANATNVHWHIFDGTLLIGSGTIPSIASGATVTQTFDLPSSSARGSGPHSISVVLDPNSAINESDEGNNASPALNFTTSAFFNG